VLAPSSEAEAAHDELLRADLGRMDSVSHGGMTVGLTSLFTDDVLYLRGGLPIIRGRTAANAIAAAESLGTNTSVRWQPVRAETSRDRSNGYTYGYTIYSTSASGAPVIRVDRYIAYWRHDGAGWRIAAYAETYGTSPPPIVLPSSAQDAIVADVPMSGTRAPVDALRSADEDFSRAASKFGTGDAFGRYAADDAQIFSGPGEFITGPEAITGSFGAPSSNSTLSWHPVDGEIARSGDIGFTVGNAVATSAEFGTPVIRYSKYLTVWKRQRDGGWRYVIDGGSDRPAPLH
jgi:ketosteroid isomerase-like protein